MNLLRAPLSNLKSDSVELLHVAEAQECQRPPWHLCYAAPAPLKFDVDAVAIQAKGDLRRSEIQCNSTSPEIRSIKSDRQGEATDLFAGR